MFYSLRYSNLILRLGLAFVFFWFGIDKFMQPEYWLNAWVPENVVRFVAQFGLSGIAFIYLNAIFEILIATSLALNIFSALFSFLGAAFLLVVIFTHGFNEVLVRDMGLLGGFLSVLFWPRNERMAGLR
ncbi:MAG: hypothetical protein A2746_01005 [Candidatus Yanofskybacteria bacterium RIFCSPHIGHO2_01_FULL_44_22]|uniref:DoxX family protein n=1 Tax=Candidatus Yanofskybacteria bacterium RIFCSPHIGHO2_01_FULL_44_22 TaxID=1802669 RepID=A0A1F8EWJ2_9BACT|nr:MAG: hypothetical protein A2746_01005 [Candidatus Yanofskybacteria bacterium RIFCSPHIGHO2_01_FULL_44_22]